ncbi:uncharacterized protein LOC132617248 [Lycium barbarum]|uniref:uncharacterized protein LOC132617248 n=1 Tax=Lycium barbarum TaxID=112863 RepID=UPI00293E595F|nr:uncharacterized protein LOC132617248 [Lycium barbarum]
MSNLSKLEFVALDISGKNYLSWVLDAEIHLDAKGLGATIIQDKAKAMVFLRHHLDEGLKVKYLIVKDPLEWFKGKDFKTVCDYNSVVYKITSQLKLCGDNITDEDMLEKTLTTFHASNLVLQQQYRERGFKKHADLISCLLVAEQHNTLLLKSHEARPTGTAPFPEANVVATHGPAERRQNSRGHNNERGRGRGKGRYYNRRDGGHHKRENNMGYQGNPSRNNCHRCGLKGHRKNECRAPEHFVRLYQNSFKRKANRGGARVESHMTSKNDDDTGPSRKYYDNVGANLALKDDDFDGLDDVTHLEVEDFF